MSSKAEEKSRREALLVVQCCLLFPACSLLACLLALLAITAALSFSSSSSSTLGNSGFWTRSGGNYSRTWEGRRRRGLLANSKLLYDFEAACHRLLFESSRHECHSGRLRGSHTQFNACGIPGAVRRDFFFSIFLLSSPLFFFQWMCE